MYMTNEYYLSPMKGKNLYLPLYVIRSFALHDSSNNLEPRGSSDSATTYKYNGQKEQ